jgi:hypothetical protein
LREIGHYYAVLLDFCCEQHKAQATKDSNPTGPELHTEEGSTMSKLAFATCLVSFVVASTPGPLREQQFEVHRQAELDADGNSYDSSDQGKLIWIDNTKRCSELREVSDQQTVGCRVMQDPELGNTLPSLQLESYRKAGHKVIIELGAPIANWRFWKDGEQVAVSFGPVDAPATYGSTIQQRLA